MRALTIFQPHQASVIEAPLPELAPHELLVRVMASGICGTDIHIFRGEYLGAYPIIPGHEFAGVVESIGSAVTRFRPGDRVAVEPNIPCNNCFECLHNRQNFCRNWQAVGVTRPGGMAQWVSVPENAAFDIGDLPFEQGAFVEPLSCVLHGMGRLGMTIADRVAILGAGPIGLLLLQVARLQGASATTVVDKNPDRAGRAVAMGADRALTSVDDLEADGYDVVIDATGVTAVMRRTLDFIRPGGKILWFGVPPRGQEVSLDAFTIFRKGLTVLSSFTSVRNSYMALALLQAGRVNVSELVSHRLPLQDFERGVTLLEQGADHVQKVIVLPND